MGEARYYGRLAFETPQEAEERADQVEEFLKRVREAEDMWQEVRGGKRGDDQLRKKFPDVFEKLKLKRPRGNTPDYCNYLAGELDSPFGEDDYEFTVNGNEVRFAGTVWHFANWESLMDALMEMTGAVKSGWVSDEYIDPWSSVPMD